MTPSQGEPRTFWPSFKAVALVFVILGGVIVGYHAAGSDATTFLAPRRKIDALVVVKADDLKRVTNHSETTDNAVSRQSEIVGKLTLEALPEGKPVDSTSLLQVKPCGLPRDDSDFAREHSGAISRTLIKLPIGAPVSASLSAGMTADLYRVKTDGGADRTTAVARVVVINFEKAKDDERFRGKPTAFADILIAPDDLPMVASGLASASFALLPVPPGCSP